MGTTLAASGPHRASPLQGGAMMTQPYHLLTLWNPSYTAGAMDEHL
jgi:hypothetical protein